MVLKIKTSLIFFSFWILFSLTLVPLSGTERAFADEIKCHDGTTQQYEYDPSQPGQREDYQRDACLKHGGPANLELQPICFIQPGPGDINRLICPSGQNLAGGNCYLKEGEDFVRRPCESLDSTIDDQFKPINSAEGVPVDCDQANLTADNCRIYYYLRLFTNILSAVVGIVIVGMLILGGIQYSTSANNPQAVNEAKRRIFNALFALVIFIFTYSFLQWIVPGGIF